MSAGMYVRRGAVCGKGRAFRRIQKMGREDALEKQFCAGRQRVEHGGRYVLKVEARGNEVEAHVRGTQVSKR